MNVSAFSLKFCQHDTVLWCSHSQRLDLCIASQFAPRGLKTQFCKEKIHTHNCLQTWAPDNQQAVFPQHERAPPTLAKLYGNSGHFQTLLDLRGNAWLLGVKVNPDGQQGKNKGICWKPSCCFWAWIFQVNTFQKLFHQQREGKTSHFYTQP